MTYIVADDQGNLVESHGNTNKIDSLNIKSKIESLYDANVTVTHENGVSDVFRVTYNENESEKVEYILAKPISSGGRNALEKEQRVQVNADSVRFLKQKEEEGNEIHLLGFYQYFEEIIVTAWEVGNSIAEHSVSKQIKIDTISEAIKIGLCQQRKSRGAYCCAFKMEFFKFYKVHKTHILEQSLSDLFSQGSLALDGSPDFSEQPRQVIYFGAPGTGKSRELDEQKRKLLDDLSDNYERVTFHPDYSFAQFVGTYKPVPKQDNDEIITYKYVPGPLIRMLVKAYNNPSEPYLLIIEEINRANVAAVFGDIFQLLDRKKSISEYPIHTSADLRKFLLEEVKNETVNTEKLAFPANFFIWATMNSADQGVFPMDTAFKRRWDFRYIGINDKDEGIQDYKVVLGEGEYQHKVYWNELRKAINNRLAEFRINEDKLIGPYFISESVLHNNDDFIATFKNKVIMYLFEDAVKHKRKELFSNVDNPNIFSKVCEEFDVKGILIFGDEILSSLTKLDIETDSNFNSSIEIDLNSEVDSIEENSDVEENSNASSELVDTEEENTEETDGD